MARLSANLGRSLALLALVLFGYALAGAIGGLIPRHPGWRPPARGVTIWVEDNGVHTGLVLPKRAAGIDWTRDFPAGDLADPRYAALGYVAVGWGERGFYLGTPTWWDVRPGVLLGAAFGSEATLVHVEHVARPLVGAQVRAITLRPEEYVRLAATIRASRAPGRAERGYYGYDAFYPGRGRYDAITTCNAWTGNTLAAAGVRVGRWTPFPAGVMHWF
ncbi:TIGR02117 family protein [Sphingomonas sp. BK235]|uniref:TIGR02117 family protein n=1 Tax=Sphingomonas sp. BK235 TaxID=2512131 RepID=UPI00104CA44A|nr:TIGR02117 family protein [Sphingomonas sp. BK235]TCP36655.1 uncharacterized protein (TIGR02117 family) [Sphingomonas sp. BK235]